MSVTLMRIAVRLQKKKIVAFLSHCVEMEIVM